MSRPWMKFYPADWRADVSLRGCSLAARGLWVEMICIMHEASPYGHLVINGKPATEKQLAVQVGASPKMIAALLKELCEARIFDVEDGVIISRRMVRDYDKALKDKENGLSGGNPRLKASVAKGVNPEVIGGDKAQKPDTRSQIPETIPSPPLTASAPEAAAADLPIDGQEIERRCIQATDWTETKGVSAIIDLARSGVDFEGRILPLLRSMARDHREIGKAPPRFWAYAVKVIQDPSRRTDAEPAAVATVWVPVDSEPWRALVDAGRKDSFLRGMSKKASDGSEGLWVPAAWLAGKVAA